jgi:hypothetical protein
METLRLEDNAYELAVAGKIIIDKMAKALRRNSSSIICSLSAINGADNTYTIYELLNK